MSMFSCYNCLRRRYLLICDLENNDNIYCDVTFLGLICYWGGWNVDDWLLDIWVFMIWTEY